MHCLSTSLLFLSSFQVHWTGDAAATSLFWKHPTNCTSPHKSISHIFSFLSIYIYIRYSFHTLGTTTLYTCMMMSVAHFQHGSAYTGMLNCAPMVVLTVPCWHGSLALGTVQFRLHYTTLHIEMGYLWRCKRGISQPVCVLCSILVAHYHQCPISTNPIITHQTPCVHVCHHPLHSHLSFTSLSLLGSRGCRFMMSVSASSYASEMAGTYSVSTKQCMVISYACWSLPDNENYHVSSQVNEKDGDGTKGEWNVCNDEQEKWRDLRNVWCESVSNWLLQVVKYQAS